MRMWLRVDYSKKIFSRGFSVITRKRLKLEENLKDRFVAPLMLYKKGPLRVFLSSRVQELQWLLCEILEKLKTLSSSRHAFPSSKKFLKNVLFISDLGSTDSGGMRFKIRKSAK